MERNLQSAADTDDLTKLARGLEQTLAFVPDPTWNAGDKGWATLARAGAAAAAAGDLARARASCKACHGSWRKRYRAEHRPRPLP
jgi:cytochrome c553